MKQNQIKSLKSDVEYEFDNIIIPFASHLRVKEWDPEKNRGGRLILHCFNTCRIDEGGSIDVSISGYYGGRYSLCSGGSYDHFGPFTNQSVRSNSGAGGGGMVSGGASYGTMGTDGTLRKNQKYSILTLIIIIIWVGIHQRQIKMMKIMNLQKMSIKKLDMQGIFMVIQDH